MKCNVMGRVTPGLPRMAIHMIRVKVPSTTAAEAILISFLLFRENTTCHEMDIAYC